jgi:hypothetical protein
MADLETLVAVMDDAAIRSLLVDRGWDDKKIKEAMK